MSDTCLQDSLSARVWSRIAVCKIRYLQNSLSVRFADCDMQDSRYCRVVRRHFVSTDLRCRCNFCSWKARGGASRQGCCTSSSRTCKKVVRPDNASFVSWLRSPFLHSNCSVLLLALKTSGVSVLHVCKGRQKERDDLQALFVPRACPFAFAVACFIVP